MNQQQMGKMMSDIKQALTERWHQELATSMDRAQFEDWVTAEADRLETLVAQLLPDREAAEIQTWREQHAGEYPDFLTATGLRTQARTSLVETVLTNEVWEDYTPEPEQKAIAEPDQSGMDRWLTEDAELASREMELLAETIWAGRSPKFRVWGEQLLQARAVDGLRLPGESDHELIAELTTTVQTALDEDAHRDAVRAAARHNR